MFSSEGTPLLRSAGAGGDGEEELRRTTLGEGDGSDFPVSRRRKGRRPGGKAIAGALMFALAAAGLVAIFNAMQDATLEASEDTTALDIVTNGDVYVSVPSGLQHGPNHGGITGRPSNGKPLEALGNKDIAGPTVTASPRKSDHTEAPEGGSIGGGAGPDVRSIQDAARSTSRDQTGTAEPAPRSGPSARVERAKGTGEPGEIAVTTSDHGVTKPNVFFIMIDDMGWNDIGYQSTDLDELTPNLDLLASNGIKMSNYYSMSICTPSRASLMTGRYPVRYGLQYNVIQPGAPWGLPLSEKIMPQYFKDEGYENHMVGKWHLGSYMHDRTPHRRGFDTYLGYLNDEERYWTHQSWTASLKGRKFFDFGFGNETAYYDIISRDYVSADTSSSSSSDDSGYSDSSTSNGTSTTENSYVGKYSTTIFTDRALEVVSKKTPYDDNPLFLYLSHQAVHDPLGLPGTDAFTDEEWAILDSIHPTSPVRKKFAKVLFYLDKEIGRFVGELDKNGWLDNSIIVVASDNGGCPTNGGTNYPLRGIKHSYWDGGNKVPAFIYSKSHLPEITRGSVYHGLMHVTDWIPTIMDSFGATPEGSAGPLDGISHWTQFVEYSGHSFSPSPRHELLYNWDPYILWTDDDSLEDAEYPLVQGAFRQGKYKLMSNAWCSGYYTFDADVEEDDPLVNANNTCSDMGTCCNCGQACLNTGVNYTDWLFDLEEDPREEVNLINEMPDVAHALRQRAIEVAFKEWTNSSYEDVNTASYYIWSRNGWWMVPWYHIYMEESASDTDSDTDSELKSGVRDMPSRDGGDSS